MRSPRGLGLHRLVLFALLAFVMAGCSAQRMERAEAERQNERIRLALDRPAYQRLYRPLFPSAATPRLTPLGDFDTPRSYRGESWRHRGIDIVGQPGDVVIAAAPGLACAGYDEINGRKVTLYPQRSPALHFDSDLAVVAPGARDGAPRAHPVRMIYGHLRRVAPDLFPCRFVALGEPLGEMGITGIASQPHLHFEVVVLNPAALEGDPNLRGAINPFFLMRRERGEPFGSITCYEASMAQQANATSPENRLSIVWPMADC